MIGKTISQLKIVEKLGEGGMGEVWLAEDLRLQRQVAVKILPEGFARDPERRGRFEREARAVAALNHPNIVTIHAIEQDEGIHYISMERVEGQSLAEVIGGKPMDTAKLLQIATQIADAVAAAHIQGITHRDLKPDNIMVGPDGRVKVLDFGLAKLSEEPGERDGTHLPTVTHQTQAGVVLGTVAYMAPEQAEGRAADSRSDVFALGVVLYEMATGGRPFEGDSHASLIASILRDTPGSVIERNKSLPRHLGRIIRICLAKDPLRRYQSAVDLRNELDELKREMNSGELVLGENPSIAPVGLPRKRLLRNGAFFLGVAAVSALTTLLVTMALRDDTGGGLTSGRFTQITDEQGVEDWPSLSPDGESIAYAKILGGDSDLFVQRVGGRNPINLTNSPDQIESAPAYSPDGQTIAFHVQRDAGGIFLVGATGESRRRLTDRGYHPAWSPDGKRIVFDTQPFGSPTGRGANSELWVADVETGALTQITDAAHDAIEPTWSPDGKRIAFWRVGDGTGQRDILTIPASGGTPTPVTADPALDFGPAWGADGYLYFSSDRRGSVGLWRVRLKANGTPVGEPEAVTNGVASSDDYVTLSRDASRLAYVSRVQRSNLATIPFDASRRTVGELVQVTRGTGQLSTPELSPDNQSLAYISATDVENLYVSRADGSDPRRLTDDSFKTRGPQWSPSGDRVAFYSDRSGSYDLWTIRPDGSGLTQVTRTPGEWLLFPVWSPSGDRMVATSYTRGRVMMIDPNRSADEQELQVLEGANFDDGRFVVVSAWSPDGRKLAGFIVDPDGGSRGLVVYDLPSRTLEVVHDTSGSPMWVDNRHLVMINGTNLVFVDTVTKTPRVIENAVPPLTFGLSIANDRSRLLLAVGDVEADLWMMDLNR